MGSPRARLRLDVRDGGGWWINCYIHIPVCSVNYH